MVEKMSASLDRELNQRGESDPTQSRREFLKDAGGATAALVGLKGVLMAAGTSAEDVEDEPQKECDTLKPPKDIMEQLKNVGDAVVIKDVERERKFTVTIGEQEIDLVASVGKGGKVSWSLEELEGLDGKKQPAVVLRLERKGDNPSIVFSKLAPKIRQMCFVKRDGLPVVGTVYAGMQEGDEVKPVNIDNRFGTEGNYGQKIPREGTMFYVQPTYKTETAAGDGTYGVFVAREGAPFETKLEDVGIVFSFTQWEKPKKE